MRLTKSGRACLTKANLKAAGITRIKMTDCCGDQVGWDIYGTKSVERVDMQSRRPRLKKVSEEYHLDSEGFEEVLKKLFFKNKYEFYNAMRKAETKGVFNASYGASFSAFC